MWELDCEESWALKNWCFELWCWRRPLRVPWTAKRSNQSFLKGISPECSLERLMLKLKLQYFGHLMGRTDSLEKTLMLGKIKHREKRGNRGWDSWMASLTQYMSLSKLHKMVKDREAWRDAVYGVANSWIQRSDSTKAFSWGPWEIWVYWFHNG